jgi:hypothetical protein
VWTKSVDGAGDGCKDGPNSGKLRACDIWEYEYQPPDTPPNKLPPQKKICPYEPAFLKPLIGAQDVEDITEFLKQHTEDEIKRGAFVFDVENGAFVDVPTYDVIKSQAACRKALDTELVVECKKMEPGKVEFAEMDTAVIEDCTMDYSTFGGPNSEEGAEELKSSVSTLEQSCIELFIRYDHRNCQDESCIKLKNVLCPQECSVKVNGKVEKHGTCDDAACQCFDGWAGKGCDVDTTVPPTVNDVDDQFCDTQTDDCPEEIVISGKGFYCEKGCNDPTKDVGPQCKFSYPGDASKDWITDAIFAGETELLCPVPTGRHHAETQLGMHAGGDELVTKVSVRSDPAYEWSTETFDFTFFDSTCTACNRETGVCEGNKETCQIDGICYKPNTESTAIDPNTGAVNPCTYCVPALARDKFSYVTQHSACTPQFVDGPVIDYFIYGNAAAGPLEGLVIDATANFNVNMMDGYADDMTYVIKNNNADEVATLWFHVDENSGQISLLKAIDIAALCNNLAHCAADPRVFNGFFRVEACDSQGVCSEVSVVIELVANANVIPFFAHAQKGGYSSDISEVAKAGDVLSFTPELKASEQFENIKYSFLAPAINMGGALAIDATSGVVTVVDPSLLDYETIDIANCTVIVLRYMCAVARGCQSLHAYDRACIQQHVCNLQ